MKRIYEKEEGVSPVIATILMVAITVVLAATVYIMVAGYGSGSTSVMGKLNYEATQSSASKAVYQISLGTPSSTDPTNVKVNLKDSSGNLGTAQTFSAFSSGKTSVSVTVNKVTYTVTIQDYNSNGKVDTGDVLIVSGTNANTVTVILSIASYSGNIQGQPTP